jgi:hypothetical protein
MIMATIGLFLALVPPWRLTYEVEERQRDDFGANKKALLPEMTYKEENTQGPLWTVFNGPPAPSDFRYRQGPRQRNERVGVFWELLAMQEIVVVGVALLLVLVALKDKHSEPT